MAEFLSAAWLAELDAAEVQADPEVTLRVDQVVIGTPGGDVRYRFTVAGGRLRVRAAEPNAAPADVTLTVDYATAVDLATGKRDASDVFATGHVRFSGDLGRLQAATAALAALATALAPVRKRTTFPTWTGGPDATG